jgi:hypothetical protein
MALLRSAVVLFVSVTILAAAMLSLLFYIGNGSWNWWSPGSLDDLSPLFHLSAVNFVTAILLMFLAWRGRRQPITDGITAMTVLVLAVCFVQFVGSSAQEPMFPDSTPIFVWIAAGIYLASLVPAHLICCLALSRTPLLRGLAPSPKSKGPAGAGPLSKTSG